MAVFQIFQDRFFYELLISIQEGLLKALVLVPPLFAAENHHSVSSYQWETDNRQIQDAEEEMELGGVRRRRRKRRDEDDQTRRQPASKGCLRCLRR